MQRPTSSPSPKVVCGWFREVCLLTVLSPSAFHRSNPSARAPEAIMPLSREYRFNQAFEEERSDKSASSSSSLLKNCRAEAVCATSRWNNLSIAPEHRTSCAALHAVSSGTVLPLEDPTAPRRVTSQLPVCVCVRLHDMAYLPCKGPLLGSRNVVRLCGAVVVADFRQT
jgi:hypothetical protein